MVRLRSNSPLVERSYLLAELVNYSFLLLILYRLSIILLPFIFNSLWLFSLYLTELLWHHDFLQHDLVFADMLLLSDLTIQFRTMCFYFSSWKQYSVKCDMCHQISKICAAWCVMLLERSWYHLFNYATLHVRVTGISNALLPELGRENIKLNGFAVHCVVLVMWT